MPADTQTLQINGHTIAYATAGDPAAPPLIMVHGLLSHGGIWRSTIAALRDSHFCVTIDLLGLANSAKPAGGDYSIPAQGRRVLALADMLQLERFSLIGHSMGGQISLHLAALAAPERVERLVDVAGVASGRLTGRMERFFKPRLWIATRQQWMWEAARRSQSRRGMIRREFGFWFYDFDSVPLDEWAIDRQMALQPGMEISAYRCIKAIGATDLTADLPRITCPTLVIFGQYDKVVPISEGTLVKARLPASELVVIDECGHMPMLERPAPYLAALRGFLDGGAQ